MISPVRILWFLLIILILASMGCTTDVQRIRETNEAERVSQKKAATESTSASTGAGAVDSGVSTAEPGPAPLVTDINALDVREGDCISSKLREGAEVETVEIVTCSGDWNFRVLNLLEVESGSQFPGDDYFGQQALLHCDARYTSILFPTPEAWGLGDRAI